MKCYYMGKNKMKKNRKKIRKKKEDTKLRKEKKGREREKCVIDREQNGGFSILIQTDRQTDRQIDRQAAPLCRRSKATASALSSISTSTGQGLLKQLVKIVHAFMKVGILKSVTVSLVHKFTSYVSKSYLHVISHMPKSSVLFPVIISNMLFIQCC